ncbi:hypothetical protein D3C87_655960 [compost metagenome]
MAQTNDLSPIEEVRAATKRIERALLGDLATGQPGLLERTRKAEERLDRHSRRIHSLEEQTDALENQGTERMRWTIRTVADRAIGAIVSGAVGAFAALMATGRPPTP